MSDRCCYAGVVEHSVYVDPEHHGRGVGRLLLTALIEATEQQGIWTIQTGIFPENVPSVALSVPLASVRSAVESASDSSLASGETYSSSNDEAASSPELSRWRHALEAIVLRGSSSKAQVRRRQFRRQPGEPRAYSLASVTVSVEVSARGAMGSTPEG